jgi:putative hydrolase of the HAD superfamily
LATDAAAALLTDYRERFPSACELFPDAADTLAALRAMGLKLGLITNGSERMQSRKIAHLALRPAFDTILISDAEGVSKPDPEIFRRALALLDTEPGCAAFVGDLPDVDIAGARRAGLTAVWRRDAAHSQRVDADAVIDQLAELIPWATESRKSQSA